MARQKGGDFRILIGPVRFQRGHLVIGEGASVKLKGRTIALEAGTTLTLKAGSSFISLGPAGVDIQGSMVKINSGGSAGPADAAAAVRAASPTAPTAALTMADLLPGQATTYDKQFKDPLAPAA